MIAATVPFVAGCRVAQPPQVESAGLRIDVNRVKQKRGVIDARLRIWNDYDASIEFEHAQVRLMVDDEREVSIRPGRRGQSVQIIARNHADVRWIFEVGSPLPKGSYEVELRDFALDGVPSGQTALFVINL